MDPATTSDSIGQLIAGGGIAISGALILKLIEAGSRWMAAKNQRTAATVGPQPFEVIPAEQYVRCAECLEHRRIIETRQNDLAAEVRGERKTIGEALGGIRKQLTENDEKAEARSLNLHQRIDPLVEAIGNLKGRVEDHVRNGNNHPTT